MNDPAQTPVRCGAPRTSTGRAAISAVNTEHGRYKNWRERQVKEKRYPVCEAKKLRKLKSWGEIKRVMREARETLFVRGSFSERSQPLFIDFNIDTQTQRNGLIIHLNQPLGTRVFKTPL